MQFVLIGIGVILILFGATVFFGAPYVPSQRQYLRRALKQLYPLGHNDLLVDIGAGDGIVLREAARLGARAVGYEINPLLVVVARWLSRGEPLVQVKLANFWTAELPAETTIVYAFSVGRDDKKLQRHLQAFVERTGHEVALMCLGNPLKGVSAVGRLDAYWLYRFYPKK